MKFALIGASGYVAPKHMKAIKDVGGELVAALDPHDSVGILDSYFRDCHFFTEFERFDRHISKMGDLDYLVVCSPNYLHDSHIRFGLRVGADVICEKPLVLHPKNLFELQKVEEDTGKRVWTILQLRHHPEVGKMLQRNWNKGGPSVVNIQYYTPRGMWYHYSWKGNHEKSGGLIFNIGVHLIDLCSYIWGDLRHVKWVDATRNHISGGLSLVNADVTFTLNIDREVRQTRVFKVDGKRIDLTKGFADLHTTSYQKIIAGLGWDLYDNAQATKTCREIADKADLLTNR